MARILLVDDDKSLARVCQRALAREGHDVETVHDHGTAITCAEAADAYDLAILDFWMEAESSLSILRALRAKSSSLPILYISGGGGGLSLEVTAALAEAGGATEFLFKPFRPRDLSARVEALLR